MQKETFCVWLTYIFAFLAEISCGAHFFLRGFFGYILLWTSFSIFGGHIIRWTFGFAFFADINYLLEDIFSIFCRHILWRTCLFADIFCGGNLCTWRTQLALTSSDVFYLQMK